MLRPDANSPLKLLGFAAKLDQRDGNYEAGPLVWNTAIDPEIEEAIYIQSWREGTDVAVLAEYILTWQRQYAVYLGERVHA